MMIRNIPLRHELKYLITPAELTVLRNTLAPLMQLDQGHEYLIRSLYFDTINDDALEEKIAGVGNRKKYRIRIYNFSDRVIKLECKSKYGDLISKQSVSIPRELADQLIAGDPEGLQRMRHPLLHDVYREMKTRLLRPVVIVDYVREAYIHPAEEVRITFDKQIRTGLYQTDMFNPNIPTEECFISPKRGVAEGIVYSTKPLSYQGQLIENFSIRFEGGKAVEVHAEKNEALLQKLISMDEGASYLGECALVPYNSPIQNSGLLFYNTLFDENAACHLALGMGFADTIKNFENYTLDECRAKGINDSMVHEDFMIGSADLSIDAHTRDGRTVPIFRDGNWAF